MIYSPNLQIKDGCTTAPDEPGWGVTIDEQRLQPPIDKADWSKAAVRQRFIGRPPNWA